MKNTAVITDLKEKLTLKHKELAKLEVEFFQKRVSEKYRNKERKILLEEIEEIRSQIEQLQVSTSKDTVEFENLYIF